MGAIGIGSPSSRQKALYDNARNHKGVEYIAACDVDKRHLDHGLEIMKKDGFTATGYSDFRALLDNADINAVTIAVPDPSLVDTAAVAKELPYGTITVTAVKGGLEIPAETGGDSIVIANAAVIVSLDDGK